MAEFIEKLRTPYNPVDKQLCTIGDCDYGCDTPQQMLAHFRRIHRQDPGFQSPCLFSTECFHVQLFKTYSGLYYHLRRFHSSFFGEHLRNSAPEHHQNNSNTETIPEESSHLGSLKFIVIFEESSAYIY